MNLTKYQDKEVRVKFMGGREGEWLGFEDRELRLGEWAGGGWSKRMDGGRERGVGDQKGVLQEGSASTMRSDT